MVSAIVSWVLLIVGIILLIVRRKTRHREALEYVGIVCTALGTVFAAAFTCIALTGNTGDANVPAPGGAAAMRQYAGKSQSWAGRNVLVIGDSVSDVDYASELDPDFHPWQESFAAALGCTVTTHARGKATLLDMIDGNEGLAIDPLTQRDVSGKDLIILFGGANDVSQGAPIGQVGDTKTGTLCGNLYYAVKRIYELLIAEDNLTCRVMLVGYYNAGLSLNEEQNPQQTIEDVAHWLGLPCINLRKTSGINPATWSIYGKPDNKHLENAGNILIGNQIAEFVENTVSPGSSQELLAMHKSETLTKQASGG